MGVGQFASGNSQSRCIHDRAVRGCYAACVFRRSRRESGSLQTQATTRPLTVRRRADHQGLSSPLPFKVRESVAGAPVAMDRS